LSVEIARKSLEDTGRLGRVHEDAGEAHSTLQFMRLYQRSMLRRARTKINRSMGFDELRKEGVDPRDYAPDEWKRVHNDHSVGGRSGEGLPVLSSRKTEELVETYERLKREEAIKRGKERKEWKMEDLLRKDDFEEGKLDGTEIVEQVSGGDRRKECTVEDVEEVVEETSIGNKDSDVPRQKTEEELEADRRRIEEKDRKLTAALDRMRGPGIS
jgi:hypothetical protein